MPDDQGPSGHDSPSPPGKRIAILQSNYIPWKGYFDLMNAVDEFVLFDTAQFTRRDWRNRNQIKTAAGLQWLTIPVATSGRYHDAIDTIAVSDPRWPERHWRTIESNYARAPHFKAIAPALKPLFLDCAETRLSAVNHRFITGICELLGIRTTLSWSSDYRLAEGQTDKLVGICLQAGARTYLSGPAAASYIEPKKFRDAGIELQYFDYGGYPEYRQLYPPFSHRVSIIDLLLNEGVEAPRFMLTF
jgi:hypothetical protein